jgi:hypothetical protein
MILLPFLVALPGFSQTGMNLRLAQLLSKTKVRREIKTLWRISAPN